MMANEDRKIAEELKTRLLACDGERIQRVLLYGSRAQGTATEESDFDLLVIEKDPVAKLEEMGRPVKLSVMSNIPSISGLWEKRSLKRQKM